MIFSYEEDWPVLKKEVYSTDFRNFNLFMLFYFQLLMNGWNVYVLYFLMADENIKR